MKLYAKDKNDLIAALACREYSAYLAEEFSKCEASENVPLSVTRRILKYIKRERRKEEYAGFYSFAKRALASILVVCSLLFAFSMSIKAVRQELWNTIVDWYDKYFVVSYDVSKDYQAPTTIEEKREPKLVPYGCEKQVLIDSASMYSVKYFDNDKDVLFYYQIPINGSINMIDNENIQVFEKILINELPAVYSFIDTEDVSYVEWSDGRYTFIIISYNTELNKNIIINIAESIN